MKELQPDWKENVEGSELQALKERNAILEAELIETKVMWAEAEGEREKMCIEFEGPY